jgi:hypothetical protein
MISRHVEESCRKWGGTYDHYREIHTFLDLTKLYLSDWRHRLLFHNTLGVNLVENLFKDVEIVSSHKTKLISSRTIAEHHVLEDLGVIPNTEWCLRKINTPQLNLSTFEDNLAKYFTKEEIDFLLLFYYQAKHKAIIYYSTLGLELLNIKFKKYALDRYVTGLMSLANSTYLKQPFEYLNSIPIERWMGGMSPRQIKYIQKEVNC